MRKLTRRTGTVAVATVAAIGVGVAFAAWTSTGTGSGTAASGQDTPIDTSVVAATTTLYPNGDGDVRLTVNNDNPYNVKVTAINGNGAITSSDAACNTGGHAVTYTDTAGTWVVPAGGSLNVELVNKAHMGNGSDNACQNDTFTIPVTLVAASTADAASTDAF